jgi:hypothetical protein
MGLNEPSKFRGDEWVWNVGFVELRVLKFGIIRI